MQWSRVHVQHGLYTLALATGARSKQSFSERSAKKCQPPRQGKPSSVFQELWFLYSVGSIPLSMHGPRAACRQGKLRANGRVTSKWHHPSVLRICSSNTKCPRTLALSSTKDNSQEMRTFQKEREGKILTGVILKREFAFSLQRT